MSRYRSPGRTSLITAALVALTLMLPAVAHAQGSAPATGTPVPWEFVDIGAQYAEGAPYSLVGGELATDTPLPAYVELAASSDSTPTWIGEVYPDEPARDKQLEYTVRKVGDMDVYAMTLTGSPLAQLEVLAPEAIVKNGSEYVVNLEWTAPWPILRARLGVMMPPNARVTKTVKGGLSATDVVGNKYYFIEALDVNANETLSLKYTYSIATAEEPAPDDDSGGSVLLYAILAAGIVVAVGLAVLLVRQQRASRRAGTSDELAEAPEHESAEAPEHELAEDEAPGHELAEDEAPGGSAR